MKVIADVGFLAAKPAKTPMDCNLRLNGSGHDLLDDPSSYR